MICALLAWYDEDEVLLERAVFSAAKAGVTALVALDGPYALYDPNVGVSSGARQAKAIRRACRALGLAFLVKVPAERWPTEMAKRTALFRLGEQLTGPADWFLVLDADYDVHRCDLPDLLADATEDVATAKLITPKGPNGRAVFGPPAEMPMRMLFRAIRGLHVEGNHYTYLTPDGRRLWGNETTSPLAPALDLTSEVSVTHWTYHRSPARVGRQFDYYRARDAAGVELGPCGVCGERLGAWMVPTNLRVRNADEMVSDWLEVCEGCEQAATLAVRAQAEALGLDPWRVTVKVPLTVQAA